MVVAWGRVKEVVREVVKVDVKVVKAVVNKHARLCVVMPVVVAVEIHASHLVVETVAVHVEHHVECPVEKHVQEHVDLIVKAVAMVAVRKLYQIR